MDMLLVKSNELPSRYVDQISTLAGIGFGQGNTEEMRQDTLDHISACDELQVVHDATGLIAFSMMRRCLWR